MAQIGTYVLHERLGEGGMGAVYRAHDPHLNRFVAIKRMHPHIARQDEFRQRFVQEAQAIAALDHPNIISVYAFHAEGDEAYLVMEYITTNSLRDFLKARGTMLLDDALLIVRQIALALDYAHGAGMIHRDVKPGNVLLKLNPPGYDGPEFNALLTDFGLVKLSGNTTMLTGGSSAMGTLAYMAPEQLRGEDIDHRADLYALGIMLYELTVGQLPFKPTNLFQAAQMHNNEIPPAPRTVQPALSKDLEAIILKAIAKSPDKRFQSAATFANVLRNLDVVPLSVRHKDSLALYLSSYAGRGFTLQIHRDGASQISISLTRDKVFVLGTDIELEGIGPNAARLEVEDHVLLTVLDEKIYLDDVLLSPEVTERIGPMQTIRVGPYSMQVVPTANPSHRRLDRQLSLPDEAIEGETAILRVSNEAIVNAIVDLLVPHLSGLAARQTFVTQALYDAPLLIHGVDYQGDTREFTINLVYECIKFGQIMPGRSAIAAILEHLREQTGSENQQKIDKIIADITRAQAQRPFQFVGGEIDGAPHVFISYTRSDMPFVQRFIRDLQSHDVKVWIDHVGLRPGTADWENALRNAIHSADGVVLVASPASRRSNYVRDELAIARAADRPIYPVWASGDEWSDSVPLGMGSIQYVDLRGDAYESGVSQLADLLSSPPEMSEPEAKSEAETRLDFTPRNPYKGLRAFRAEDRQDFFGRDVLIEELVSALNFKKKEPRFLAVVGASGSGKSSVIMAGLLPAMQDGAIPGSEHWYYLDPIVPGIHPLENLTIALARLFPQKSQAAIREDLENANTRGLHSLVRQVAGSSRLVIYIDQFEELFTLTKSEEERHQFIDLLTTATNEPNGAAIVIISLRADFYDRPLEYNELGELIKARNCPILPMTIADLYEVIEAPAQQDDVQIRFEEGLATELVFAVRDEVGTLPLLQFTLDQLFQLRNGRDLTLKAYQAIGGVRGALTKHAEQTYQDLPSDEHRQMARVLFLRLIEPGLTEQDTTRRRAARAELTLTHHGPTQVLQETSEFFIKNRLIVSDDDTIEVAHEALIREWDRLNGWLSESRDGLRLQHKISADATDWVRANKPANYGGFYTGTLLQDARRWLDNNVAASEETGFIVASIETEEARQARDATIARRVQNFRRASMVLGVMAFVAIIVSIFAGITADTAREENSKAQTAQARANADVGTAEADQMTALSDADAAGTQVAIVVPTITEANREIMHANETLTPIPATLTVAVEQYATAQEDLQQAQDEANGASTQIARFEPTIAYANTEIAGVQPTLNAANQEISDANATLTPIPATLTVAVEQVLGAQEDAEQARNEANGASTQIARFEPTIAYAGTQIAGVQPTLDAAEMRIVDSQSTLGALDDEKAQAELLLDARQLIIRAQDLYQNSQDQPLALALAYEASLVDGSSLVQNILGDIAYRPGARLRFEGHSEPVIGGVDFSPDGSMAISGSCGELDEEAGTCILGEILLWEVQTGEIVQRFEGHQGQVRSLSFNSDGTQLISGSCGERDPENACILGEVILWDVESGGIVRTFRGHTDWVWSVALSPDDSRILSGSNDSTMILWDLESGEIVRRFAGHTDRVRSVAIGSDGTRILSGSEDRTVILWNAASGEIVRRLEGHSLPVWSVAFSPDGTQALSGSTDFSIIVWDLTSGQMIRRIKEHVAPVRSAMFSPDGSLAISGSDDRSIILWDTSNWEVKERLRGHSDSIWDVSFNNSGSRIVSGSRDNSVILWDIFSGEIVRRFNTEQGKINAVAYSPDGTQILTGGADNSLILWDVDTGEIIQTFEGHTGPIRSTVFSQDGSMMISGSNDTSLILWDVETGDIIRQFTGHNDFVTAVALSSDGLRAVSGSCAERTANNFCQQSETIVWDVQTGEIIHRLHHHRLFVQAVAISPDGSVALSGSADVTLFLWDLDTGDILDEFEGHSRGVQSVAFSRDGSLALSGSNDTTLILWDVDSGDIVRRFQGHTDWVRSVAISPDGALAVSASYDDTVLLWDLNQGLILNRLEGHSDDVTNVAFSPDGTSVISSSADNTLILWRIDDLDRLQEWITENRHLPELTCEQRETYGLPADRRCVNGTLPPQQQSARSTS